MSVKINSLLRRLNPAPYIYVMTMHSIAPYHVEAAAWTRAHLLQWGDCYRVLVLWRLRIGLFYCYARNGEGKVYLEHDWVAHRLYIRRLKVPPALEWCE